jgi:hypothetical protein
MSTIKMSDEIDHNRRRFCGTPPMTIAAAQFGMIGSAEAQSSNGHGSGAAHLTFFCIQSSTNLMITSLFFSKNISCPFPLMPTSSRRTKSVFTPA